MVQALPEFPWSKLAPLRARAGEHPRGLIDCSVGSPVDPVPERVQRVLSASADAHGYPTAWGSEEARDAVVEWFARTRGVSGLTRDEVLLTVGSKEFVATAALWLGLGAGDAVVQPTLAYPTYQIGAMIAGAELVSLDDPAHWPDNTKLVWLNSPSNPDGRVLSVEELRRAVARARELGAVLISDECYAEFCWVGESGVSPSVLDSRVNGGSMERLLVTSSLSKRSNMAGYRAAYVAGDGDLIAALLGPRRHAGLMVPLPVQRALAVALSDDAEIQAQRSHYAHRRDLLIPALESWGARVAHSNGGLYLWVTEGRSCWDTLWRLAEHGMLAAPGAFYGDEGATFVRVALTASDSDVAEASRRLSGN